MRHIARSRYPILGAVGHVKAPAPVRDPRTDIHELARCPLGRRASLMTGRIRVRASRQRAWADSPVKHLAQPGGERVRVAGLAVLPAQEAAVVARETRRLNPEGTGDGHRGALR